MPLTGEQVLLRIYLDSADRTPHTPTVDRIVRRARLRRLAGCTVFSGILGATGGTAIRSSAWSLIQHHPVVVEIVDRPENIATFVDQDLAELMPAGLATLERAAVIRYRHRHADAAPLPPLPGAVQPLSNLPELQPRPNMKSDDTGILLRIFIGESDRAGNVPLYQAIVEKAREMGLAGATVLRGTEGFGAHSVIHKAQLLEISADLPIVVEIVDTEPRIQSLLPHLEQMVTEGLITMENVRILAYRAG